MPKFYITSGSIQRIQVAPTAFDAMVLALKKEMEGDGEINIGIAFEASQSGFPDDRPNPCEGCKSTEWDDCEKCPINQKDEIDDEIYCNTLNVVEAAGVADQFDLSKGINTDIDEDIDKDIDEFIDGFLDLDKED
jgi:hypothetical protein